ncbi:MAG: hypothetical protein HS116_24345 [Planctomycetes bacterium]|nr:hypothetical protein [Planctomycetota bacterium]
MEGSPEGLDKTMWRLAKAIEKAVYCPRNPVERKRVRSPEAWRWSNFRWLELGKKEQEPMAVDDWNERLRDDPDGEALAAYTRSQWRQCLKGTRKEEA